MDKLKIIYRDLQDENYFYEFRIPEDLNWFVITRSSIKKDDEYNTDQLFYNGNKTILKGYLYKNKIKHDKYYDDKFEIQKQFAHNILKTLSVNSFTLNILDRLGFTTKKLKLKYLKSYLFNNEKYELEENMAYNKRSFIILSNKNNDVLGELSINEENVKVEIYSNKQLDIEKLYKTIDKTLNNNQQKK